MTLPVRPPVKPMLAKVQPEIPRGDGWVYEPKWDGFRTIAFSDIGEVDLRSRNDRPMVRYFPEIAELLASELDGDWVIDGEIVMPSPEGLDFDSLQLRLHPAASRVAKLAAEIPTSFVAFDVLARGSDDVRTLSLSERMDLLDEMLGSKLPLSPADPAILPGTQLFLTPRTADPGVAAEWFDELEKVRLDGIIAKRLEGPYAEGERVWTKIKHRRTADCVVGGYRPHKHGGVGSLLLGLYDEGKLHYIGHTSSFGAAARRELESMLEPLRTESSFFGDWGPGGPSRWSGGRDVQWVAIDPVLVCEVSYDYVQSGHRFRHAATFLRWRDDKSPDDCTFEQVRN